MFAVARWVGPFASYKISRACLRQGDSWAGGWGLEDRVAVAVPSVDGLEVPLLTLDPGGCVRDWNEAMERLSGYSQAGAWMG